MVIQINGADFSACGIGTMPMIISDEAKDIVNHYTIADLTRKEKAYQAMQVFMNTLGYGSDSSIWSKLTILSMPCFSSNVQEAFYNIKDDTQLNAPNETNDIANIYDFTSEYGLRWSRAAAIANNIDLTVADACAKWSISSDTLYDVKTQAIVVKAYNVDDIRQNTPWALQQSIFGGLNFNTYTNAPYAFSIGSGEVRDYSNWSNSYIKADGKIYSITTNCDAYDYKLRISNYTYGINSKSYIEVYYQDYHMPPALVQSMAPNRLFNSYAYTTSMSATELPYGPELYVIACAPTISDDEAFTLTNAINTVYDIMYK